MSLPVSSEPSRELVEVRPRQLFDPLHGEVLDLASVTPERLAQLLIEMADVESKFREVRGVVHDELVARMDRDRSWTLHLEGGVKLSAPSDAPKVEWDVEGVIEELDKLVNEGVLSESAREKAIDVVVTRKLRAVGINALLKSRVFAERLEPFRREVEAPRRVSVKRA